MKLKICGMKSNTKEVAALQPDYLGFIFWEPSSRFYSESIPADTGDAKKVGVFVDALLEDVILKLLENDLDAIQLHGKEDPEYCARLKSVITGNMNVGVAIIKAFSVDENFDFETLAPYEPVCDFYLFDTRGELPGGTGRSFDWSILKRYTHTKPYFLSGGIGPDSAKALVEFTKQPESRYCYAIDVNSRFEIEPGLKDINLLKNFIQEIGSER